MIERRQGHGHEYINRSWLSVIIAWINLYSYVRNLTCMQWQYSRSIVSPSLSLLNTACAMCIQNITNISNGRIHRILSYMPHFPFPIVKINGLFSWYCRNQFYLNFISVWISLSLRHFFPPKRFEVCCAHCFIAQVLYLYTFWCIILHSGCILLLLFVYVRASNSIDRCRPIDRCDAVIAFLPE